MDFTPFDRVNLPLAHSFCYCSPPAPPSCLVLQKYRRLIPAHARLYWSSTIHKLTEILNLETKWCPICQALGKESWMTNTVPGLDVFANPKSCDLWARHMGPKEEVTLGCITGFFHQRIIAGRQVTKSKHILPSREYHQRQKQTPAGKKESLAHSPFTRLPSKMLVVGSCFNNDSSKWWQCSLELSLQSGCFMFHKTSNEEKEGHYQGEGCASVSSSRSRCPDLHIRQISFQRLCALIVQELTTDHKIIVSDISTFKKKMTSIYE